MPNTKSTDTSPTQSVTPLPATRAITTAKTGTDAMDTAVE